MPDRLREIIATDSNGKREGIYALCSAHPMVLAAGMRQAIDDDTPLLIEATANQVNQNGGYSGHTPAEFKARLAALARAEAFAPQRLLLGGDHLGPHIWRGETAEKAMAKAMAMVTAYVQAGFAKLHLDTERCCRDDPQTADGQLPLELTVQRTVALIRTAQDALPDNAHPPVYVIGCEVPYPGGGVKRTGITPVPRLAHMLQMTRRQLEALGMDTAAERIIAAAVGSGADFGDNRVSAYQPHATRELQQWAAREAVTLEAHSTDYQLPQNLATMVQHGFGILKVGPWLTFALREALYALAAIEAKWLQSDKAVTLSNLRQVLTTTLRREPAHWAAYYSGTPEQIQMPLEYGYLDRLRYYWTHAAIAGAVEQLIQNLSRAPIPLPLLSQYLPAQYNAIRNGALTPAPVEMIRHKIRTVIDIYARACRLK